MRKVLHKVKSQWIVLGVLGATVVSLGTADVRQVSASEIEGASASETIAARELGTADVSVEAAEKAAHIGVDNAIDTATTDGTATVFVHWNEDGTITVTVKDLNGSVLYSELLVDSEDENTIKVLTANQDYYTIDIAVKAAATEQTTTATEPIEQAVPEVLAEVDAAEEVAAEENDYAKIVSTTEVDYPAVIARATDAINTAPWGVEGYQTLASSADYAGKTVDVTKEQVTDYGVTWALVSLNGKELGWIAKDALTVQTYAAITSETVVDYPATISRGTDAINLAPWGTKGYQTIASSAAYVGKTVDVIKEQTTDYGVTWAQISLNGEVLGWIAKDALAVQTYAAVVSETVVDYPATVNRDSDAINTAPWGVKGYQTLSSSAAYAGQTVEVSKEQVTDYGVTWAQISLNGKVLGWIAKDALKIQTYAQITKETAVDYSATISRDSDAINTAPWGVKGYQTLSSSAAYAGQTVEVTKEQVTDYGVTWALVSQNGKELGWIAKDALKVQSYAQIIKETAVNYDAIVNRDSDAINTAPWGVKGYQTLSSSAAYAGQTVEVTKEQVTDYGVTWALVSQNGKELGWIAKDALKVQTYAQITKETAVNYDAIVSRDSDAINTAPWGVKGYQTLSSSAAYAGQTVEVTKEQTTDYGVTWALVSQNGKELGWIAKDALKVQTYAQIVSENEVAYPALINRGTDAINTAPWGTKGYQTNASSADYLGQTVEVTKEQTTDYGVTWALVSLNGKELGWIAKDALIVMERTMETVVAKENTVAYQTVTEEDNTIPTGESQVAQAGVDGYDTVTYDVTYVNGVETNRVEVSRTKTTPVNEIVKVGTQVTEVKSETITENEVDFTTVEEEDNTIPTGERVVVQAGVNGYDTVTYDVTFVNGVETNRVEAGRTTTALVNEIVKVGTQVTEVKSETKVEKEIAYATVEESDNTIPTGERVVAQVGAKGYDKVTYDVTYVNGVETNRVETSRGTTAPVSEIVKVGTQVTEVKSETITEKTVAYTSVEELDNTIPTGERVVVQAGVKGYDTVTFDVTYVNGVETNRVEVSRKTTAPIAEVVKVGTQVTEVKSETITEKTVVYTSVEEFDNTIPTGERVVVQAGANGYDTVTYDVTYVNGLETNRVEAIRTTTAPVAEVIKVGTQVTEVKSVTTIENEVAYATIQEFDNTIPIGERIVVQAGENGYDTITYDVTYVNGIETNRVEVRRTTTTPVSEIVKVGTQVTEVFQEEAIENEITYTTIEEEENTLPIGDQVVVQSGVKGYDMVTYEVIYVNGVETDRIEVSRSTVAPINEIVKLGSQVVEVVNNEVELVLALSDSEIDVVVLGNDIQLLETASLMISGNSKIIQGNNYTITTNIANLNIYAETKIENMNNLILKSDYNINLSLKYGGQLDNVQSEKLNIFSNLTLRLFNSHVSNVNIVNAPDTKIINSKISGSGIVAKHSSNLIIDNVDVNLSDDTYTGISLNTWVSASISNTIISGGRIGIYADLNGWSTTIVNTRIIGSSEYGIYNDGDTNGSHLILSDVEISGAETYGIYNRGSYRGGSIAVPTGTTLTFDVGNALAIYQEYGYLYVDGEILHMGNSYTLFDSINSETYDSNGELKLVLQSDAGKFYNSVNRVGNEVIGVTVQVSTEDELRDALSNSGVNTVEVMNDIELLDSNSLVADGLLKKISGNNFTIKSVGDLISNQFLEMENVTIANDNIFNLNLSRGGKLSNVVAPNMRVWANGTTYFLNSELYGVEIYAGNKSRISDVVIGEGGIRISDSQDVVIDNITIDMADSNRTGIYLGNRTAVAIINATITGGQIGIYADLNGVTSTIVNTRIIGSSEYGIYNDGDTNGSHLILSDVEISGAETYGIYNRGSYRGGSIAVPTGTTLTFDVGNALAIYQEYGYLYVDGEILHMGNSYTLFDSINSETYDSNGELKLVLQSDAGKFYNSVNRVGNEVIGVTVQVSTEDELRDALSNSGVNTVEVMNDIELLDSNSLVADGLLKKISGNNFTIKSVGDLISNQFLEMENVTIANDNIFNLNLSRGGKLSNVVAPNMRVWANGTTYFLNSELYGVEIYAGNKSRISDVVIGEGGIRISDSQDVVIDNINIDMTDSDRIGIYLGNRTAVDIKNATITGGQIGIYAELNGVTSTIGNTRIIGSSEYGIYNNGGVNGSHLTLSDVEIIDTGSFGIYNGGGNSAGSITVLAETALMLDNEITAGIYQENGYLNLYGNLNSTNSKVVLISDIKSNINDFLNQLICLNLESVSYKEFILK
ncbi:G5 domain-containing protein [Trichococcus shcherbakoviae]|nr:G5 domain-containing protein [Trichococcus shcherbakoviae]